MTDTITPAEAAALARIREGWVVVPREATGAMLRAADKANGHDVTATTLVDIPRVVRIADAYRAMLAAAPEADSHDD